MEAQERFAQFLASRGLRSSTPRSRVARIFLRTERHVSTGELYDLVRKKHKEIGYATVSRTLKLLEEAGLCRQVDFGDGILRYEHAYKHAHHDHLVCTRCGEFVEIFSDKLEKLQDEMVKKHGYVQETHRLNIFGVCPKCQKKKSNIRQG